MVTARPRTRARLSGILCLIAVTAGCVKPSGSSAPEDREPPRASDDLIRTAALALAAAPRLPDVWPGFALADRALLFYEDERAVLMSGRRPPRAWRPLGPEDLPTELEGRAFFRRGSLPGLSGNFDTDYTVGTIEAAAVALQGDAFGTLETFFHELFHRYQQTHFGPTEGAGDLESQEERFLTPASISDPDFVAMAEVERRILLDVLTVRDLDSLAALTYSYLAVRRARLSASEPQVRAAELNIERKEGSAHLVGLEAAALATGASLERVVQSLRRTLEMDFDSASAESGAYTRFRFRLYGTGGATGHILDRLGVPWRDRMERGASFYDLLVDVLPFDSTRSASLTGRALARYGFVQIRQGLSERSPEPTTEDAVAAFLSLDSVPVVLTVHETGKQLRFEASGGFPNQPERDLFLHPEAAAVNITAPEIELAAERHPVMIDVRAAPALARITLLLPAPPEIDGKAPPPGRSNWPRGVKLRADNFRLRIERSATIHFSGDSLAIEVEP